MSFCGGSWGLGEFGAEAPFGVAQAGSNTEEETGRGRQPTVMEQRNEGQ
jgi:hypothetical protein